MQESTWYIPHTCKHNQCFSVSICWGVRDVRQSLNTDTYFLKWNNKFLVKKYMFNLCLETKPDSNLPFILFSIQNLQIIFIYNYYYTLLLHKLKAILNPFASTCSNWLLITKKLLFFSPLKSRKYHYKPITCNP